VGIFLTIPPSIFAEDLHLLLGIIHKHGISNYWHLVNIAQ
jgi:hypothetical protein